MKALRGSGFGIVAMVLMALLGTVLQGCSKKQNVQLDTASFNSAPADVKEKWNAAAQYGASRNYMGAATNLSDIFAKAQQLTAEQNEALNKAWDELGNQAFAAANQGDKSATEAILKMKATGIGDRRGR